MSYARHQTFHIRSGWLAKALEELGKDCRLFSKKDASIRVGIGKNMVQALRFWVEAVGLVNQKPLKKLNGKQGMVLTKFGNIVKKHDPYFEFDITWWIIHYNIVKDETQATSWHYLFNVYTRSEFDQFNFIDKISTYTNNAVRESSYKKDFDCIISTYVKDDKVSDTPEDNIICPLTDLGLIKTKGNSYYKTSPSKQIPLEVLLLVIREAADGNVFINISNLENDACNIGKVFNLSLDKIYFYLDLMQEKGWLKFSRTAGIDSLVLSELDVWQLITDTYKTMNKGAVNK